MNLKSFFGWTVSIVFFGNLIYFATWQFNYGPLSDKGIAALFITSLMLIGFGTGYFIGKP
jgi:hypothetical protein